MHAGKPATADAVFLGLHQAPNAITAIIVTTLKSVADGGEETRTLAVNRSHCRGKLTRFSRLVGVNIRVHPLIPSLSLGPPLSDVCLQSPRISYPYPLLVRYTFAWTAIVRPTFARSCSRHLRHTHSFSGLETLEQAGCTISCTTTNLLTVGGLASQSLTLVKGVDVFRVGTPCLFLPLRNCSHRCSRRAVCMQHRYCKLWWWRSLLS